MLERPKRSLVEGGKHTPGFPWYRNSQNKKGATWAPFVFVSACPYGAASDWALTWAASAASGISTANLALYSATAAS